MPTIRVRPETYERMKNWAIPLEDTPNDVIEKLLNLAEAHRNPAPSVDAADQEGTANQPSTPIQD